MKKVWITGASSGIGRALSIKFSNEGWQVAISARRVSLLNEISNSNQNIYSFPLDVSDPDKCQDIFNQIQEKFGSLDVAIFCAGINNPSREKNFDLENINEIFRTNFFGTINSINSVYNYFKKRKSGQLVIISSIAGYRGLPSSAAYCSSKSALTTFAESLYFDLYRYNVGISIVNPGFIKTPMTDTNRFFMPMIKSSEYAAEKIFNGVTKKKSFEIHFPKTFTYLMKIFKFLPAKIYFKIHIIINNYLTKR